MIFYFSAFTEKNTFLPLTIILWCNNAQTTILMLFGKWMIHARKGQLEAMGNIVVSGGSRLWPLSAMAINDFPDFHVES